jgi:hypothetical protein
MKQKLRSVAYPLRAAQNPPSRGEAGAGKSTGKNLRVRMKVPQNQSLVGRVRVLSRESNPRPAHCQGVVCPPRDAACCKAVRSGARLIRDTTRHQPSRGEHDSRAPVHRRLPAVPCGHGDSHAARPCRRRNAAARSRPHCRQRHRCSLRSIRRLSGVSGCPLPRWVGISSRRILRRSISGKWMTAVLLVQSTPPLPR